MGMKVHCLKRPVRCCTGSDMAGRNCFNSITLRHYNSLALSAGSTQISV